MRKLRTALGGACLVAALMGCAGTTPALAATGNTGTTKVTVVADENNLKFLRRRKRRHTDGSQRHDHQDREPLGLWPQGH